VDAVARGEDDGATSPALLFDSSDAADLDGTVSVDEKAVVGDEGGIFEFVLGGGCHADARREVKGNGTRGHEGEGCRAGIDLGREDASNGRASCATTDDDDALAASLGHCVSGKVREEGRRVEGELEKTAVIENERDMLFVRLYIKTTGCSQYCMDGRHSFASPRGCC